MKIAYVALLTLGISSAGLSDFSYMVTSKWSASPIAETTERRYFKGKKMNVENGPVSTIVDLDAQTVTRIDHAQKSYSVTRFSDIPTESNQTDVVVTVDVRKTGQTKSISGYAASEVIITADMDSPEIRKRPIKVQAEDSLWVSPLPGGEELRAFFGKDRARYWSALAGQPKPQNAVAKAVQEAFAGMEGRKAELDGVILLEVFKLRAAAGGAQGPNIQDWAQGRAQLEETRKKGGPGAAAATQALARADAMGGDPFALMQQTMTSSDFSTETIPDTVFGIPAEYRLVSAADQLRETIEEGQRKQAAIKSAAGVNGGVIGGIIGSVPVGAPTPPPPPAAAFGQATTPQRLRVGGNVQQARLIRQAKPVYPPLARQAGISGHVLLDIIVNKDGTIQNLTIVSGHPLLVPAAMEAVKQWVYQPTLLNGAPVEVVTQVDMNFTLGDNPRPLPPGQVGRHFSEVLPADGPIVSGAQTWALVSGNLPPGLGLDTKTGAISGEPSTAGDFIFAVHLAKGDAEATFRFSIHIDAAR